MVSSKKKTFLRPSFLELEFADTCVFFSNFYDLLYVTAILSHKILVW